jgi:hypothetical protein
MRPEESTDSRPWVEFHTFPASPVRVCVSATALLTYAANAEIGTITVGAHLAVS